RGDLGGDVVDDALALGADALEGCAVTGRRLDAAGKQAIEHGVGVGLGVEALAGAGVDVAVVDAAGEAGDVPLGAVRALHAELEAGEVGGPWQRLGDDLIDRGGAAVLAHGGVAGPQAAVGHLVQ